MKRGIYTLLGLLLFTLPVSAQNTAEAKVSFKIRNAGVNVNGSMDSVLVVLENYKGNWKQTKIKGRAYAASINTGIAFRDRHLRNEDYFDVQTYPWIRMESTRLELESPDLLTGLFTLYLKDKIQEIQIPFNLEKQKEYWLLTGAFELSREDYELGKKSLILSDTVRIEIRLKLSLETGQ